jgi:hypothetical protein
LLFQPFCTLRCEDVQGDNCCVDCDYSISVVAIHPGDTVTEVWDGRLYWTDQERCSDCECYYSTDPFVGTYRLTVDAYNAVYCYTDICDPPPESGVVYNLMVEGESIQYETQLTVPYEGEGPTIAITGRDSRCDDGTIPACLMPEPECDDTFEILAYQNSCYRCVNPITCLPWGEPGCETDKDCAGKTCAECATSSCPVCDDCLKACV